MFQPGAIKVKLDEVKRRCPGGEDYAVTWCQPRKICAQVGRCAVPQTHLFVCSKPLLTSRINCSIFEDTPCERKGAPETLAKEVIVGL